MKINRLFTIGAICVLPLLHANAQKNNGGISNETLQNLRNSYQETPANKAIRNAIAGNSIDKLAL
ncbi:MAG: aminopeptidase, partial [Muribaculaceae bacterium]|nr:aminopeptidase [Muribaculaceae bacterium]